VITVYTYIAIVVIFRQHLFHSKITSIFLLSYLIKVVFPFYYFSLNSEINLFADLLSSVSLSFIVSISLLSSGVLSKSNPNIYLNKKYIYGAMLFLPVTWLLFIIPALIELSPLPLYLALNGDYIGAHLSRVYITKSSTLGVLVDIVGKVVFPIFLLVISLSYKTQSKSERFITYLCLLLTLFVSFLYFQKAFPFILILIFTLGLSLCGYLSKLSWVKFGLVCAVLLLFVSTLYGSDISNGILKFQDLLFRRLGKTPVLVYLAYVDYGNLYDIKLLENNFILNKTPQNPALPMLIYQFMSYGNSATGWANGLYVGDLFVNFGIVGVVAISLLIGYIIRLGNRFLYQARYNLSFLLGLMAIIMLSLSLPGNSFFGFSTFFYLFLFLVSNFINRFVNIRKPKIVLKLKKYHLH
jgi:hypothetical protein